MADNTNLMGADYIGEHPEKMKYAGFYVRAHPYDITLDEYNIAHLNVNAGRSYFLVDEINEFATNRASSLQIHFPKYPYDGDTFAIIYPQKYQVEQELPFLPCPHGSDYYH